jgi:CrcB protein
VTILLVFAGGGVGSVLRYLTDRWVQARHGLNLPLGTLLVNLAGCLILGVVAGGIAHAGWSPRLQSLLGDGLCGGLTTFSAFSVEVVTLARDRLPVRAAGYTVVSVATGIGLAALGWAVT